MKKLLVLLTSTTLLAGADTRAMNATDLTAYAGTFKGDGTVRAIGMSFPCKLKAKIVVAKSGRSAKVNLSGSVMGTPDTIPMGTVISLRRSGKQKTSNIVFLNEGQIYAANGKYKQTSNKLKGSTVVMVESITATQKTTFVVKPRGKKRRSLKISLDVLANGSPFYEFDFNLTGR